MLNKNYRPKLHSIAVDKIEKGYIYGWNSYGEADQKPVMALKAPYVRVYEVEVELYSTKTRMFNLMEPDELYTFQGQYGKIEPPNDFNIDSEVKVSQLE